MGQEEGGCCLLTREDLRGTVHVLQPPLINVQLEEGFANQEPLLLDVELLLENSKGPESRNLNSLHTEKTERLRREFLRDGKRDDSQSRGTLLCALPAPEGQWGKVGHFGKLWRRAASSVSFITPLPGFATIPWLGKSPEVSSTRLRPGTDYPRHGPRIFPHLSARPLHSGRREE